MEKKFKHAEPMLLCSGMTIEAGFQAILGSCITQIQDNAIGVVQGADSESIHQMRVGVRQLCSALGLFARWIPCPPTLQQELGWLASELGAARDADVRALFASDALSGRHQRVDQVAGRVIEEADCAQHPDRSGQGHPKE
jgi:CHAD domain-containing protein